jgi:trans-aconitate methyltransferase
LKLFPRAQVWGVDLSPEMLSQSRKRNLAAVRANRLALIEGNATSLAQVSPIDIIFANHVLYFWHEPAAEVAQLHALIRPGGLLALGYQLKQNMPPMAQTHFPRDGHVLYQSDTDVKMLWQRWLSVRNAPGQGSTRDTSRPLGTSDCLRSHR